MATVFEGKNSILPNGTSSTWTDGNPKPIKSTIPRNELQALCGGANLAWIVKQSLDKWVESSQLLILKSLSI